jgi:plasmid stabilization system protein ParE
MAADIHWLDQAQDDLEEILRFISTESPKAAAKYVAAIREAAARLAEFPQSGRAYDAKRRVLVVRNHFIFYRFDATDNEIVIVGLIDGRRDLEKILDLLGH